jgi:hypothetical protein
MTARKPTARRKRDMRAIALLLTGDQLGHIAVALASGHITLAAADARAAAAVRAAMKGAGR